MVSAIRISDIVAEHIIKMLEESDGYAEIQRNELALEIGCVPSQINYVITSRFTPEQGYIVESRRGGGGYIRIKRINTENSVLIMHIVNSIGDKISESTVKIMLSNLNVQKILSDDSVRLMRSALSDKSYVNVPPIFRDALRASVFKNMLLTRI